MDLRALGSWGPWLFGSLGLRVLGIEANRVLGSQGLRVFQVLRECYSDEGFMKVE